MANGTTCILFLSVSLFAIICAGYFSSVCVRVNSRSCCRSCYSSVMSYARGMPTSLIWNDTSTSCLSKLLISSPCYSATTHLNHHPQRRRSHRRGDQTRHAVAVLPAVPGISRRSFTSRRHRHREVVGPPPPVSRSSPSVRYKRCSSDIDRPKNLSCIFSGSSHIKPENVVDPVPTCYAAVRSFYSCVIPTLIFDLLN